MQTRSWTGTWSFKHPTVKPRVTSGKTVVSASSNTEARTKIQTQVSQQLFGTENFRSHVKVKISEGGN